jgi:GcrA cell cycle regulator
MTKYTWTTQKEEQLKTIWQANKSNASKGLTTLRYRDIAKQLFGTEDARNAIAGKLFRMGCTLDPLEVRRRMSMYSQRHEDKRRLLGNRGNRNAAFTRKLRSRGEMLFNGTTYPLEGLTPTHGFECTLVDLKADSCRAPLGDPTSDGFRFCGAGGTAHPGPYCAYHHALYYGYIDPPEPSVPVGPRDTRPHDQFAGLFGAPADAEDGEFATVGFIGTISTELAA